MNHRLTAEASRGPTPNGHTITSLVSGILDDGQRLVQQQVAMVRAEIQEDLQRTKQSMLALGLGIGITSLGVILLSVSLVYLLEVLTAPHLPLWSCWAIVGGAWLIIGGIALANGYRILSKHNPLPDKSFTALQETVSWIANRQR